MGPLTFTCAANPRKEETLHSGKSYFSINSFSPGSGDALCLSVAVGEQTVSELLIDRLLLAELYAQRTPISFKGRKAPANSRKGPLKITAEVTGV